jgi:hypothetical protein
MKSKFLSIVLSFLLLLLLVNVAPAAEVAQGKCLAYNTAGKRISLEEFSPEISKDYPYGPPTGRVSEFDVAKAKIGITPEPGDVLRIAYTVEDGVRQAIKVMNVSKQDLRKK